MVVISMNYQGDLKVECKYEKTNASLITSPSIKADPEGHTFPPSTLCAVALGSCSLTTVIAYGEKHGIDMSGIKVDAIETMTPDYKRIARVDLIFYMPAREYSDREKKSLERAAKVCPVHHSLAPEVEQVYDFRWPEQA